MGPQLYRCGNPDQSVSVVVLRSSLQWGRNFIVAEMEHLHYVGKWNVMLQWGRNFIVAEM